MSYSRRNSCSKFSRSRQIARVSLTRRQVRLLGGPFQPVPPGLHRTAGCVVPSVLSLPNLAEMGASQRITPVRGQSAVVWRSPVPLAAKQIRPAFTAHLSTRPLTPMLPSVSWPNRQQPCSMPRSFCAHRSAGNGGGGGGGALATGGGSGLGGSTGLHCATLSLRSACSAASSALRVFSSPCASSSAAFSTDVGSGGGGGAGGAGVSRVVRFVDASTGAQARRNHEAISSARSSNSPNSSAASQRDQPRPAGRATISEGCSAIPRSLAFGASVLALAMTLSPPQRISSAPRQQGR